MEPISLTCPKCGTSWKLIKAGTGPVTCPHCKAPLDGPAPEPAPAAPPPAEPAPTPAPAAPEPVGVPEPVPAPIPGLTPTAALPPMDIPEDTDDPGLQADYDERYERPRRGMHPLLKVTIILLVLMVLVPVAVVVLFFAVCAILIARS